VRHDDPIPPIKRELAVELVRIMSSYRTTDVLANVRIDQPRVSDLRRGRLERISVERLIRWLSQMGYRVEFNLTKVPGHRLVLLD
jgi:predicted XRE-type DNA-binding protein